MRPRISNVHLTKLVEYTYHPGTGFPNQDFPMWFAYRFSPSHRHNPGRMRDGHGLVLDK